MKVSNGEINQAQAPFRDLTTRRLPVKTAYALARIGAKLAEQMAIIEGVRKGLFETYGKPDPKKLHNLQMLEEFDTYPKFMAEMEELYAETVELEIDPVMLPLTVDSVCEKCNTPVTRPLEIEPAILMLLDKFIKVA